MHTLIVLHFVGQPVVDLQITNMPQGQPDPYHLQELNNRKGCIELGFVTGLLALVAASHAHHCITLK